ncbi:12395_t:CDS:2 [Acaulospora morrowiae]|uniref:Gamma-soluble NSF attachment protein n=1 Tax=Acaulospora morrowiae TaxID=94023 RepID=A0A9N8VE74_9GLOM|nr:12395_t:CDS:2 [Acaulospora morrowiae]
MEPKRAHPLTVITLILRNSETYGDPKCNQEYRSLGLCMPEKGAVQLPLTYEIHVYMFFGYKLRIVIVLSVFVYYAHKHNPNDESFRNYMLTREESKDNSASNSSKELFKFFNKLLVGQPTVPEFYHNDYYCWSIVKLKDGSASYIGFYDKWYLLSKIEIISSGRNKKQSDSATEMQILEGSAYNEKEAAIKAKGQRDYNKAARLFLSAAKKFQKVGDDSNLLEAAICYEDAYKAFQQTNQIDKALEALETAASIYETSDRQNSRAARTYEKLGEQYKKITNPDRDLEKAINMYRKAGLLLELEGDGRYIFSLISQAELSAEIGHYEQAIELFDMIIVFASNDSLLNFKIKDHIFWQCMCIIALEDWVRLEIRLKEAVEQYPSFADSRERAFIDDLITAKNACDPSEFATACKKYDQLTKLLPWQTSVLLRAKKDLESEDLR